MLRSLRFAAAVGGLAIALAGILPGIASAHEKRPVAGKYTFVVGFVNEPALAEEPNGLDLRISDATSNEPIEGAEKTLQAEVLFGGASKSLALRARYGQKGAYTADLIPTKPGTYQFHIHGTLGDTAIDETFESGPGRFNDVQAKDALEFPGTVPSVGQLAGQVQASAQPTTTPAPLASASEAAPHVHYATQGDVQKALDRADAARILAIGCGFGGLLLGALAGFAAAIVLKTRGARGMAAVVAPRNAEPI